MSATEATDRARQLLSQRAMVDAWTASHGTVETAIPIEFPRGNVQGWLVPVTHGERMAGYFRFAADLATVQYSAFSRRLEDTSVVLTARAWMDKEFVRSVAQKELKSNESAGEPYLSYDGTPARVAWAVPITTPGGRERTVYVVGDVAFEGRGNSNSTGG